MLHSYIWENCLIWESVAYNNITQIFLYGSASFTVLHFLIYICGPLFCFGYLISFKVYFRSISLMYSGTLWHVQKCFWYIITKFTPSIILLYLPPFFLKWFPRVSFFHFHRWAIMVPPMFILLHPFLISSTLLLVSNLRQNLFCLLSFLKEDILFFIISYTGSFTVTFASIWVLWLELVHPLHFSPFYLSPLSVIISIVLNILY
jgi:hypothetical protein